MEEHEIGEVEIREMERGRGGGGRWRDGRRVVIIYLANY